MNISLYRDGKQHLFTNDNLKVGDKVFPLVHTFHKVGDKVFPLVHTFHENGQIFIIDIIGGRPNDDPFTVLACTGWPSEPHTIKDFYNYEGIQYVHTDKGYSPAIVYFKLYVAHNAPIDEKKDQLINGLIESLEAALDLIDQYEPSNSIYGHSVTRNACNDVLRIAKAKKMMNEV